LHAGWMGEMAVGRRVTPLGGATFDEREARLWAYAVSLGATRDDAADIVQEAFARRTQAIAQGRDLHNEDGWLYATVHHLVVDEARHRSAFRRAFARLVGLRETHGIVDPPEVAGDEVWTAVEALPTRQRAAIHLRYRADLDYAAIASVLNVSEGAARSYVAKALITLERHLGPRRDEL
jgi:RNA polymerase sigma factor (sigma-70 family)